MAEFAVGDVVRVEMPKGVNKRGAVGISVLYATWPEARFDGAKGKVVQINPRGTYGIPLYLVDFRDQDNRVTIPWQAEWFREEWLVPAGERKPQPVDTAGAEMAAEGYGQTTTEEST